MQVLDSNRLSYGPFHRRFESAFAAEHDSRHAVFCNSGTSALRIALQALKEKHGWSDGDEVMVPSVTPLPVPQDPQVGAPPSVSCRQSVPKEHVAF